jgi:hypothetical protein
LREFPSVAVKYDAVTFNRDVAMRRRKVEFLGLGHPLIDALITYLRSPRWQGTVAEFSSSVSDRSVSVRWFVTVQMEGGKEKQYYRHVMVNALGSTSEVDERQDLDSLRDVSSQPNDAHPIFDERVRDFAKADLECFLAGVRANSDGVLALRPELVGVVTHS